MPDLAVMVNASAASYQAAVGISMGDHDFLFGVGLVLGGSGFGFGGSIFGLGGISGLSVFDVE